MEVPEGLSWWRGWPGGSEWLAALPGVAAACAEQWDLRLGAPFQPATIAFVVPAERRDGTRAVLKIDFPETESEHEAAALAHWNGDGAARLLEADAERAALLIERLAPARSLRSVPEAEANTIAAGVLRRLWSTPPGPTRSPSSASTRWWRPGPPTRPAARRPSRGCSTSPPASSASCCRAPARRRSCTRTPTPATCCSTSTAAGSRSTPSRWSASARSTARRWCATAARS